MIDADTMPTTPLRLSEEEWAGIQILEARTWNEGAWPDFESKLERERGYQREVLDQLRISGMIGIVVEIGSGPSPVLEQVGGNFLGVAVDPLWPEYLKRHAWPTRCALRSDCAEQLNIASSSAHHVLTTNALDHFKDPLAALDEMIRILRPGGMLWLHYCIDNATKGNPQPPHKIDLNPGIIDPFLKTKLALKRGDIQPYGWRRQDAWVGVYRKIEDLPTAPV